MPFDNHLGYPITFFPIHGEISNRMEMIKVALLKIQSAHQKNSSRNPVIPAELMAINTRKKITHQTLHQKASAIPFRGYEAWKELCQ